MQKTSDITSKRLIALAPNDWVRWATNIDDAKDCEVLSGEFQLLSRNTDALVLVKSSSVGMFLVFFEIQTRYTLEMPLRMRAYAALAAEKYKIPVVPILMVILPYGKEIPRSYESEFLGIKAYQDFRVIKLWEVEAESILTQKLNSLIPFIPTMKGGTDEKLLRKAQMQLELDQDLRESGKLGDLETALQIFAKAILGDKAGEILRWTMIDLILESPFYQEIVEKGVEKGVQKGLQQGLQLGKVEEIHQTLISLLTNRFGDIDEFLQNSINRLSLAESRKLVDMIFDFQSLDDVQSQLNDMSLS